jgi:hypothetical protein
MTVYYKKGRVETRIVELEVHAHGSLDICVQVDNLKTADSEVTADITIVDGGIRTTYPGCAYPIHMFSNCESEKKSFDITPLSSLTEKIIDRLTKAEYNEEEESLVVVKQHISKIRSYYSWLVSASSGQPNFKSPGYYADILTDLIKEADDFLTGLYEPVG